MGEHMNSLSPSGWYSDPSGLDCDRFWDGKDWTNQTRPKSLPQHWPPPQIKATSTGLDSAEKLILLIIAVAIVLVALIGSGY
jgi:hypothetical protein